MVGLGTDGASVMTGQHHSLQSLLRRTWPHVLHNSCTNHALDLVAKGAVKAALPSSVEFILMASFNWFSHSAGRIDDYRKIANLIGVGNEEDIEDEPVEQLGEQQKETSGMAKTLRLISPSTTRWLVLADCIERLLPQYDALSAHFQVAGRKGNFV